MLTPQKKKLFRRWMSCASARGAFSCAPASLRSCLKARSSKSNKLYFALRVHLLLIPMKDWNMGWDEYELLSRKLCAKVRKTRFKPDFVAAKYDGWIVFPYEKSEKLKRA